MYMHACLYVRAADNVIICESDSILGTLGLNYTVHAWTLCELQSK